MKTKSQNLLGALALLALLTLNLQLSTGFAQSTAFTYQGRVTDNGTNFNGSGQFQFALVTSTNANHTATATATANPPSGGFITGYTVTVGGNGYTGSTVPLTINGGGGLGAAAHANISGGVVTSVTVDNPGNGQYISAPTVLIAPPLPAITYTTYWSNDGTSVNGSEPSAAANVTVNDGLFTVVLGDTTIPNMAAIDASLFSQPNLQLRIWFDDGVNGFAALDPAQNLTPVPYAVTAITENLSVQQNTNGAPNIVNGAPNNFIASGVYGATIAGGGATNDNEFYAGIISFSNSVTANFGTVSGGEQNTSGAYATVSGGALNTASGGSATVSGGSQNTASVQFATVGGGQLNTASGAFATVSGGWVNIASGSGAFIGGGGVYLTDVGDGEFGLTRGTNIASGVSSTISGGVTNVASGDFSTVGGGFGNHATNTYATVGGGYDNTVSGEYATVSGGYDNTASGEYATVGGGYTNTASGDYATVGGGINNTASGDFAFAAGYNAQAVNAGAFVWSDASGTLTTSTANYSVTFRAGGGYRLFTGSGTAGVTLAGGGTAWATISDQNAKKNFAPVNGETVLDKLAQVPVEKWNYKWEKNSDTPNIGPMAQAFKAAFYPGRDDKSITTLEFDGVELAAIQGLNQKLNEKDAEIQDLKQRLDRLEKMISDSTDKQ